MRNTAVVIITLVLGTGSLANLRGQSTTEPAKRPAFEVASVKRVVGDRRNGSMPMPRIDRFSTTSATLRLLIQSAYRRRLSENRIIVNGPRWIDSEDFDIDAKIEDGAGTVETLYLPDGKGSPGLANLMLRALLEERFKLTVHEETRDMPIYALTLARKDRRLGPKLIKSDVDCGRVMAERIHALEKTGDFPPLLPGQVFQCASGGPPGRLFGNNVSMQSLSDVLTSSVNRGADSPVTRPVMDRTGLEGNFNLTLEWAPDAIRAEARGVSIFTALQEQLGLKLEPARGLVDVIVIDHVELPTSD
jgi:uncharacterized protein (TIGR03435 family)